MEVAGDQPKDVRKNALRQGGELLSFLLSFPFLPFLLTDNYFFSRPSLSFLPSVFPSFPSMLRFALGSVPISVFSRDRLAKDVDCFGDCVLGVFGVAEGEIDQGVLVDSFLKQCCGRPEHFERQSRV